jgi:hypothetical protein
MTDALHEDQCAWIIISRSVLPRIRNVSEKICREYKNTFFVQKQFFENRALDYIMWKGTAE